MSRHWFEATPNKTAVETIFVGKERAYNRRFLQMCSHYLLSKLYERTSVVITTNPSFSE